MPKKWQFQQFKPQKARGTLTESMWTDPDWIVERKYDGDRRIAQFCVADGAVRFTGTRESVDGTGFVEKTENVPHLSQGKIVALDGTVLDGEMVVPAKVCVSCERNKHDTCGAMIGYTCYCPCRGGLSKFVTAVMGSKPERAIQLQQERGWLQYVVFDCLFYRGQDLRQMPLEVRRMRAVSVLHDWRNPHASFAGTSLHNDRKREFYDRLVAAGHEGVVLKRLDHTYGDEKLWVKVKREATADVVIMGFKAGKGKNTGMVGSVQIGQFKPVARVCSVGVTFGALEAVGFARGFDDDLMHQMTAHPKKFIGQVMEIKHNGREPTGKFRHPRFSRWRPDKNAKDCIWREGES